MTDDTDSHRPIWLDLFLIVMSTILFASMVALGNWQLRRLDWKETLIAAVETRAYGQAVAAPNGIGSEDDYAYQRVYAEGVFLHDDAIKVKALTELGAGQWLMTPLEIADTVLWVNRGFIPAGLDTDQITQPDGLQRIEGLFRLSEPGGTLLEKNDPANDLWFSRDVAALSKAADIVDYRPYFIDSDHYGAPTDWPRGGLTILKFRNSHLSYAVTWYAMALLFAGAMIYVVYLRVTNRLKD